MPSYHLKFMEPQLLMLLRIVMVIFVINNMIIHCTTMPGALLIEKCKANLRNGTYPVIITIYDRVHTALNLAEDAGLAGRVEVWDIQQFLSANVYEP